MEQISAVGAPWHLCDDAHLAIVDGAIVGLNTQADEYFFIGASEAGQILPFLAGGDSCQKPANGSGIAGFPEILPDLERKGIVTRNAEQGRRFEPLQHFVASIEVPGPDIDQIPKVRIGHVISIAAAVMRAWFLIYVMGLSAALRSARRMRDEARSNLQPDVNQASNLIEIFRRVRPLFYGAKDRCLLNSLSLLIFLSRNGLSPNWTFGVALDPFHAHCWLEDEHFLYNDQYARTHDFTVIMRV